VGDGVRLGWLVGVGLGWGVNVGSRVAEGLGVGEDAGPVVGCGGVLVSWAVFTLLQPATQSSDARIKMRNVLELMGISTPLACI
jgi:hypothetical protein